MISTGDANYDAILQRAAEIREELRLARPAPIQPPNFSFDLGQFRMLVSFERISGQKAA